ncbi:MAG: SMP-30/gluconolactonase/LRE family protein, partial [Desulfococcaceae bacterium]|nr:SMP-30/gluconolactonase/LRE family protein [Desulfococcaceae bacterium]
MREPSFPNGGPNGSGDGELEEPAGIAVHENTIFIADTNNRRIQKFTTDGIFLQKWSASGNNPGEFYQPRGLAIDENDNIYVADANNHRIQKFNSFGKLLKIWGQEGTGNGDFGTPYGLHVKDDHVYVADTKNDRIQVFDPDGEYEDQWGTEGDDPGRLNDPSGIAFDDEGNIYVADWENHRIQKFNPDRSFNSVWGSFGDETGKFNNPQALIVVNGFIYVADTGNSRIQKCDLLQGGNPEKWEILKTGSLQMYEPAGIAADRDGNIYISDTGNHRFLKFDNNGNFIIEYGQFGSDPGQLKYPEGIAVDSMGRVYISDSENHRIQVFEKINPDEEKTYKAVIAAGGGPFPGNHLWDATRSCANFAYRTLTMRGFSKNDIYYLSEDSAVDLDNNGAADDVFGIPSLQNFTTVLAQKIGTPDQLVIYLVDHGGDGLFRMDETENLTVSGLSQMINLSDTEVIFVYDACRSGSFLPDFSPKAARTVTVTSSAAAEESYFIGQGSASFSNWFWMRIFSGDSVGAAFAVSALSVQSVQSVTGGMQNP